MSDTIELLETIGKDASLRRAPAEDLARALAGLNASAALKQAAASGDAGHLAEELGYRKLQSNNHPGQTAPEEEEFEPTPFGEGDEDVNPGQDDEPTAV